MDNNDYLKHYGILGMKWGKRGSSIVTIQRGSSKHDKLNSKLEYVEKKHDKKQARIQKLTKKLEKRGGYITTIGYTMSKNTGRKLAKELHRDKKLVKRIDRLKKKIDKNKEHMKLNLKDLPKEDLKLGKAIVDSMLKGA